MPLNTAKSRYSTWVKVVGFVLLQDNDSKHTSHLCKRDLKRKEKGDLVVMNFPPQSPHLNPMENLWDQLKRCMCGIIQNIRMMFYLHEFI